MPIYEYRCLDCEHEFEKLVRNGNERVVCLACGTEHVMRKISLFASKSGDRFVSAGTGGGCGCGRGGCGCSMH